MGINEDGDRQDARATIPSASAAGFFALVLMTLFNHETLRWKNIR